MGRKTKDEWRTKKLSAPNWSNMISMSCLLPFFRAFGGNVVLQRPLIATDAVARA